MDKCDDKLGCIHVDRSCDDYDKCTVDTCVEGEYEYKCIHKSKHCDDGNPCTIDTCNSETGECKHVDKMCEVPDDNARKECLEAFCDKHNGVCRLKPKVGVQTGVWG